MAGAPPPPGPTLPAPQGARDVLGGEAAELPGPLHAGGGVPGGGTEGGCAGRQVLEAVQLTRVCVSHWGTAARTCAPRPGSGSQWGGGFVTVPSGGLLKDPIISELVQLVPRPGKVPGSLKASDSTSCPRSCQGLS